MGTHVDNRGKSRKQKHMNEDGGARARRVSFKQYLREVEERLEDDGLDDQDDTQYGNDEEQL